MALPTEVFSFVNHSVARKTYQKPQLIGYGSVSVLTKSGASGPLEGNPPGCASGPQPGKALPCNNGSDIRCKENIVRIGTHASGFGLYLYDYRPEFAGRMGVGKFFGVMAQEVLPHNPAAVVLDAWGYYGVNYAALEANTVQ